MTIDSNLLTGFQYGISIGVSITLAGILLVWWLHSIKEADREIEMREKLASYAHETWSGWMKYMFNKCESTVHGEMIPPELVERWNRQMNTEYKDLSDKEKQSDRDEADKMMRIMR